MHLPRPLTGHTVTLEPIEERHRAELMSLAIDPAIWEFTLVSATPETYGVWFQEMLDEPNAISYAVRLNATGELVGSTRFKQISVKDARLEIGSTWYAQNVWGTRVNPECKYLLMCEAFENFKVNRVELCTDLLNTRSQAAIAKLGAQREGVLRRHKITDRGRVRDTVYYSIIREEWANVKQKLEQRIA